MDKRRRSNIVINDSNLFKDLKELNSWREEFLGRFKSLISLVYDLGVDDFLRGKTRTVEDSIPLY